MGRVPSMLPPAAAKSPANVSSTPLAGTQSDATLRSMTWWQRLSFKMRAFDFFHYKVPKGLILAITDGHPEKLSVKEVYSWWGTIFTLFIVALVLFCFGLFFVTFLSQYPSTKSSITRSINDQYPVPMFGITLRPYNNRSTVFHDPSVFKVVAKQVFVTGFDSTYSFAPAQVLDCSQLSTFFMGWMSSEPGSFCPYGASFGGSQAQQTEQFLQVELQPCIFSDSTPDCQFNTSDVLDVLSSMVVTVTLREHSYPDDKVYKFDYRLSDTGTALDVTHYLSVFRTTSLDDNIFAPSFGPQQDYILFSRERVVPAGTDPAETLWRLSIRQDFYKTFQIVTYESWAEFFAKCGGIFIFVFAIIFWISIKYNVYKFQEDNPNFNQKLSNVIFHRAQTTLESSNRVSELASAGLRVAGSGERGRSYSTYGSFVPASFGPQPAVSSLQLRHNSSRELLPKAAEKPTAEPSPFSSVPSTPARLRSFTAAPRSAGPLVAATLPASHRIDFPAEELD